MARYIKCEDFDITKLSFGAIQKTSNISKVPIQYHGKPLNILSPRAMSHWGISDYKGNGDFNLAVPLRNDSVHVESFKRMFEEIDEKVKEYASDKTAELFDSKKRKRENDYYSTLKDVELKVGGGEIKKVNFKIDKKKDNSYAMELYRKDDKKKLYPTEEAKYDCPVKYLPKSNTVQFIFSVEHIWIKQNTYGVRLTFRQGTVATFTPATFEGECFIQDDDGKATASDV